MDAQDIGFTIACIFGFIGMFVGFGISSMRQRRVVPGLWLAVACLSIFWLEAPYDWSMYAQFRPGLWRLPHWGPLGATHQGLPTLAVPGYVLYFGVPTVIAVAIARRVLARRPDRPTATLLGVGLAVGFVWDLTWEIVGTRLGLWRFARTAPGLVLWGGTKYQVPIYCFLAMAIPVMTFTYLAGRVYANGSTPIEQRVSQRISSTRMRMAATGLTFVIIAQIVYFGTMVPFLITKHAGLQTSVSNEQLFPGISNQQK
jgi:hypothetical protein